MILFLTWIRHFVFSVEKCKKSPSHIDVGLSWRIFVRIEENGKTTVGQAADTDTLVASANAYINALNKMIIKRKRTAPQEYGQQKKEYEQQKMKGI